MVKKKRGINAFAAGETVSTEDGAVTVTITKLHCDINTIEGRVTKTRGPLAETVLAPHARQDGFAVGMELLFEPHGAQVWRTRDKSGAAYYLPTLYLILSLNGIKKLLKKEY